ncbi:MAG: HD domain-containing protein [Rhodospirillaceae bacterium]
MSDPKTDPTKDGTQFAPWVLPGLQQSAFTKAFVDRILTHLKELDDSRAEAPGFDKVTRLDHCLQTATLAHQAGEDEEYVVCCVLHDIGDLLAPFNHGEFAAALLEPFISEKNHWLIANHHAFQGYYYFGNIGLDKNLRDRYRDHPWFKDAVHFCDAYDMPAFDPDMAFMSLDDFEPMMRRLLMAPKKSIWVPNPPAE